MNLAGRPSGDEKPQEPFVPDFSEGAETGLYLALLELLDEGLIITGDEVILEVNSAACRLLGRDYRQLAGQPLAGLFPSERAFLTARARLFIQGEMRGSLQVATPDGERRLRFIAAARIRPGIHALILSPDSSTDDTAPTDTLWPRLAAALEQPVLVLDQNAHVAAANAAALRTLGVERSALVGRLIDDCLHIEWPTGDAPPVATLHPASGPAQSARVLPGPRPHWRLLILPPVSAITGAPDTAAGPPPQSQPQPALSLPADAQAESRAEYIATHDILTGLPNRSLFERRFNEAVERARTHHRNVGVLRLDLDNFRTVNQDHGHNTGDAVMRQIARRLQAAIPPKATLARERSDSFLLLLPETDLSSELGRCADTVLNAVAQPLATEANPVRLSASAGIAIFPEHGSALDSLILRASSALAHARRLGGNNHQFYADTMEGSGLERLAFESMLRHAVARDQLALHFQPLVDGRSKRLRGGEALLRWQHPELGLIPFRRFMPAARQAGVLAELGDWALTEACRLAAAWPCPDGQAPMLTLNIAIEQLMQGRLAEHVLAALEASGLAPERLELDFDEVLLVEEHARIQSTLERLAAMGVRLAIDAYGSGPSSIPRLKRLPLDAIKLDPALVREVGSCESAEAIVEAITTMAGVLDLEVFARGVEGEAQQAFLCALNCHLQQGPLFGQPMSAAAFAAHLQARTL